MTTTFTSDNEEDFNNNNNNDDSANRALTFQKTDNVYYKPCTGTEGGKNEMESLHQRTSCVENPYCYIEGPQANFSRFYNCFDNKKSKYKWYLIVVLIISIFVFSLIVIFTYYKFQSNVTKLQHQIDHLKLLEENSRDPEKVKRNLQLSPQNASHHDIDRTMKRRRISIALCGKGRHITPIQKGLPVTEWNVKIKNGEIAYDDQHGTVIIKKNGVYHLYIQMYFAKNADKSVDNLHFSIRKNTHTSLVVANVPQKSCPLYCSKSASRIVKLEKGDRIDVSGYNHGVQFYMACDKAFYGLYLLD